MGNDLKTIRVEFGWEIIIPEIDDIFTPSVELCEATISNETYIRLGRN